MVLGAVATGSIKAQLALIAAGTIRASGLMSDDRLIAARIGKISVVVARLLVISVRKVINKQIARISKKRCQLEIYANDWPNEALSPDETNEFAIAIPPPKSRSIPHGILDAVDQSSNFPPFPFGMRNIATTATKATLASFAFGRFSQDCQPPNG